MKREIKFRAWHKSTSVMYWFDLMWGNHRQGNGYIGMVPWGEEQSKPGNYRGNMILVDPDDCEIMQYAGLMDKNGKEIYEGDILKSPDNIMFPVLFEGGSFTWGGEPLNYDDNDGNFINYPSMWATIVGNVHQNPELLKAGVS